MTDNNRTPMVPARLAEIREWLTAWEADPKHVDPDVVNECTVAQLLADLDFQAARADAAEARGGGEIRSLRARVLVEASDVERVGVTRAHVEAWLGAHGEWLRIDDGSHPDVSVWQRSKHGVVRVAEGPWLLETVHSLARTERRPGLDILDEMAKSTEPKR